MRNVNWMDKEQCKYKCVRTICGSSSYFFIEKIEVIWKEPSKFPTILLVRQLYLPSLPFHGPTVNKLSVLPLKASPSSGHWIMSLRTFKNIAPEVPPFHASLCFAFRSIIPTRKQTHCCFSHMKHKCFPWLPFCNQLLFHFFAHLCSKISPKSLHPYLPTETSLGWSGFLMCSTLQTKC